MPAGRGFFSGIAWVVSAPLSKERRNEMLFETPGPGEGEEGGGAPEEGGGDGGEGGGEGGGEQGA